MNSKLCTFPIEVYGKLSCTFLSFHTFTHILDRIIIQYFMFWMNFCLILMREVQIYSVNVPKVLNVRFWECYASGLNRQRTMQRTFLHKLCIGDSCCSSWRRGFCVVLEKFTHEKSLVFQESTTPTAGSTPCFVVFRLVPDDVEEKVFSFVSATRSTLCWICPTSTQSLIKDWEGTGFNDLHSRLKPVIAI